MKNINVVLLSLIIFFSILSCKKSSNQNVPDIKSDLVAYYPFSGNARDSSGNAYHGTIIGCSLVPDRKGVNNSAYSFNGTDKINIPTLKLLSGADKITISFWRRYPLGLLQSPSNYYIFKAGLKFSIVSFFFEEGGTKDSIQIWSEGCTQRYPNFCISNVGIKTEAEKWNHFAIIYDGAKSGFQKCSFYQNGKFVTYLLYGGENLFTTFPVLNSDYFYISNSTQSTSITKPGELDEFRIYKRVLTPEQISYLANN